MHLHTFPLAHPGLILDDRRPHAPREANPHAEREVHVFLSRPFMRLSLVVWIIVSNFVIAGETWPQFRGPQGAGLSDSTGLPTKWSETENVVWKTAIHDRGWSS